MKRSNNLSILVVFVLTMLTAPQSLRLVSADDTKGPAKVVATVNGVSIYEDALEAETDRQLKKNKIGMYPQQSNERQKMKVLDSLIENELLRQASYKQPVADLEEKVSRKIEELKGKYPSEEEFVKSLEKKGDTLEKLKSEIRESVIHDEYLRKHEITNVKIPDADIEKFYNNNKKNFTVPEQFKVRHVLISFDGTDAGEVEKAAKKAREARERIIKEKDFAKIAKEMSGCATASIGGDLGYIKKGYMPAEFDKVAFAMKVGEVSEPVRTQYGFHIIELLEKKEEAVQPLAEVKDVIARYLRPFAEKNRLTAHIADLRKKASIKVQLQ